MAEKLSLTADVYSPNAVKTIKFDGDQPSRVLKTIPSFMKSIFRVSSSGFFEDEIKWSKLGDRVDFFGQWRAKVSLDGRTTFWIKVKVIGEQSSKDKKGSVKIYIQPYTKTTMPYDNVWDKMLASIYSYMSYKKTIRKYIERRMLYLNQFEDSLKRDLGL
jgi:hypothetical protein